MRKNYEAPMLFVDEYVADTMIASTATVDAPAKPDGTTKNGNAGNNQNCWGCNQYLLQVDPNDDDNLCLYLPNTQAYLEWC